MVLQIRRWGFNVSLFTYCLLMKHHHGVVIDAGAADWTFIRCLRWQHCWLTLRCLDSVGASHFVSHILPTLVSGGVFFGLFTAFLTLLRKAPCHVLFDSLFCYADFTRWLKPGRWFWTSWVFGAQIWVWHTWTPTQSLQSLRYDHTDSH